MAPPSASLPGGGRAAFPAKGAWWSLLAGDLRFRDVDSLKIDRFQLSFHVGSNPNGETKKWFDNVVAATRYIGPMKTP